jgi:predicted aspartyl protease
MGYVKVKVRIASAEDPSRGEEMELLADSGAIYTIVPKSVLQRLGIRERGRQRFRVADGRAIERAYGVMLVEWEGPVGATRVIFGGERDASVLGVTALEELGLKINPVTGALEPLELLLL